MQCLLLNDTKSLRQIIIIIVFNPGDLYYLGYKKQ